MGQRRKARELAMQALFLMDTSNVSESDAFKIVTRHVKPDEDDVSFAFTKALIAGTTLNKIKIDETLSKTAANWTLSRMAAVDRNILRLAAFELLYTPDTPANVVLDEAIEIVRKFSTEEATKFVNGILDKIKNERA
jgi:N utilization substance protein B